MLNLTIHTARRVSSNDLRLAIDPPLFFEVKSYLTFDLNTRLVEWQNAGRSDVGEAADLVSRIFISVGQNGHVYPLHSREAVGELRETIEAGNPGEGDNFIVALLNGFVVSHFSFFSREQTGSALSQPTSGNGSSPAS